MTPLKFCLNMFSLNWKKIEKTPNDHWRNLALKVLFVIIFGCVDFYTLYYKLRYIYTELNVSIRITDVVQQVFDFCQFMVDFTFVYKYGRAYSLEYSKQYECIDRMLGEGRFVSDDRRMLFNVVFFIVIWLISSVCDFTAWYIIYGITTPLIFSASYIFLFIKMLTMLDLSTQIIEIECRLKKILENVRYLYENTDYLPNVSLEHDVIRNENWFHCKTKQSIMKVKKSEKMSIQQGIPGEAKYLNWCYLLLTEQVAFINHMFGIRILLNSLSLLIDMVRFANISVRVIIGKQRNISHETNILPAVSNFMRLLTCIAVIANLVNHCERVYNVKGTITVVLDHLLIIKNPGKQCRESASTLQHLMQSRPILFNMANFFILNYSFLVSIASVVVTYTIILLQSIN